MVLRAPSVNLCVTNNYTEIHGDFTEGHREINMFMETNRITEKIIGCAIEVHRHLGPGLLESAYEECLTYELNKAGMKTERQKPVPVMYKEIRMECGYRIDLQVEDTVILEIKSVESFSPVHEAQLLTNLKLSKKMIGLLINFNVAVLKNGIKRYKM